MGRLFALYRRDGDGYTVDFRAGFDKLAARILDLCLATEDTTISHLDDCHHHDYEPGLSMTAFKRPFTKSREWTILFAVPTTNISRAAYRRLLIFISLVAHAPNTRFLMPSSTFTEILPTSARGKRRAFSKCVMGAVPMFAGCFSKTVLPAIA